MPRNYDKDIVYCTSWSAGDEELRQEFLDAAHDDGYGKFPGVFQKVIIKRYFKALREGRVLPEGMNMQMFLAMQAAQQAPGLALTQAAYPAYPSAVPTPVPAAAPARLSSAELAELEAVPEVVEENNDPDSMADEMDFFLNQDDDE